MGKLRSLKVFLGLVNIFITLAHLQASPKLSNFGLYTAPEGQKSQKMPNRSEKGKNAIFCQSWFGPWRLNQGFIWCFMGKLRSLKMFLGLVNISASLSYPQTYWNVIPVQEAKIWKIYQIGLKRQIFVFLPIWIWTMETLPRCCMILLYYKGTIV